MTLAWCCADVPLRKYSLTHSLTCTETVGTITTFHILCYTQPGESALSVTTGWDTMNHVSAYTLLAHPVAVWGEWDSVQTSPTEVASRCTMRSCGIATMLCPLISMIRWPTRTPPRSPIPPRSRLHIYAVTTTTRHRASTSMYSLTFCVRVLLLERH